jgi:hypothetical protein
MLCVPLDAGPAPAADELLLPPELPQAASRTVATLAAPSAASDLLGRIDLIQVPNPHCEGPRTRPTSGIFVIWHKGHTICNISL